MSTDHVSVCVTQPYVIIFGFRGFRVVMIDRILRHSSASPGVQAAISRALDAGLGGSKRMTVDDATFLLSARKSSEIHLIGAAADAVRSSRCGDGVGFVINRNINFTNSCVKRCGFCAFSRTGIDSEAYFLPMDEIVRRAREGVSLGATEICVQAGLPPNMHPDLYTDVASALKEAVPE
eukprot:86578-Amorphochlora_amoeboformis.AAC.1